VQAAVTTTLVHWESTGYAQMAINGLELAKGNVYYAAVRAVNRAGLWGNVEVSDGVTVGKNEIKPDPKQTTAVGFDAVRATNANYTSEEERRAAEGGGTFGSLSLPPGGLGDKEGTDEQPPAESIVAGVLDGDDLSGSGDVPDAVDPAIVPPPANNFFFGGYSFAIKAKDANGDLLQGFRFAKPMLISLTYTVPAGLPPGALYTPQLNLYNLETVRGVLTRGHDGGRGRGAGPGGGRRRRAAACNSPPLPRMPSLSPYPHPPTAGCVGPGGAVVPAWRPLRGGGPRALAVLGARVPSDAVLAVLPAAARGAAARARRLHGAGA
jgi:hypothetical protein